VAVTSQISARVSSFRSLTLCGRYELSVDQYCESKLNDWRNARIAKNLKHLANLEDAVHNHILAIREKKRAKLVEAKLIEDLTEEMNKKRNDLKQSIEVWTLV
jgi:hypothetical protein